VLELGFWVRVGVSVWVRARVRVRVRAGVRVRVRVTVRVRVRAGVRVGVVVRVKTWCIPVILDLSNVVSDIGRSHHPDLSPSITSIFPILIILQIFHQSIFRVQCNTWVSLAQSNSVDAQPPSFVHFQQVR
jgi:hypothetical protein